MSRNARIVAAAAALAVTAPLVVLGAAGPASAHGATSPGGDAHHAPPPASQQFVTRAGSQLTLAGKTFRFAGTNNYYLEYSAPVMTDAVLENAAASGSTVVRAWAFLDVPTATDTGDKGAYFQYWDGTQPAYNDGADGLEKLDYVVAKAGAEGLRLVLPLTNNWSDFGGMDQYVAWAGGTYHSDFYSDPTIRQWYKNWISHVLNRTNTITGIKYKDDPTIMAWELANEPRCVGSGRFPRDPSCTVDTLASWVTDISGFIKTVDRHHLVGTGDEGFFNEAGSPDDWTRNGNEGVDSKAFAATPSIDYLSYHLYPDSWGKDTAWGTQWIKDHSTAARAVGKPAILGEYGSKDKATRNVVYRDWTDAVRTSGGAGALFWILSDVREDGTLYPDYDGFTVYASSPVSITLKNFATSLTAKGEVSFPPVADDDTFQTEFGIPVTGSLTANDVAYRARLAARSLDLDPATSGTQGTLTTAAGTFAVDATGTLTFTPVDGFSGKATASYTVADQRHRTSNTAKIVVTVKPSATAAETLFDFSDGTQGWTGGGTTGVNGSGQLTISTTGGWFGAQLAAPGDFSSRSRLSFDLVTTAGTSPILALKLGPDWTWCQATPLSWVSTPATGSDAVSFDLTTLDDTCTALLGEVHAVSVWFNAGDHVIDNVGVS
jgi:mannan endo-1,4-beta-mannosidase